MGKKNMDLSKRKGWLIVLDNTEGILKIIKTPKGMKEGTQKHEEWINGQADENCQFMQIKKLNIKIEV